jgi:membrane protein required for colicin V production
LNWLDVVIIALIVWFTFAAFHAGFLRETVTVIAALLGMIVAGLFYEDLSDQIMENFFDNQDAARLISFAVLLGSVVVAGQILSLVLKPAVHKFQLGVFDQLAGAAFGFFKALVLIEVALFAIITLGSHDWSLRTTIDQSVFGSLIIDYGNVMLRVLPDEFDVALKNFSTSL